MARVVQSAAQLWGVKISSWAKCFLMFELQAQLCQHSMPGYFLKGLETLELRMKQQSQNALEIAQWLEKQAGVERVYHPWS
jgi:cystathionine beta-lyase/cystathionine gamma-synthase